VSHFGKWLVSLAALSGALAASGRADAFCRTKACDTDPSYGDAWDGPEPTQCVRNAQGCLLEGTPLFWESHCLSFGVQRDGSALSGIDFETARATVQAGFDTWMAADCGDGAPSFRVVDQGEIACAGIEYNQNAPNANVILFRDDEWPYQNLGGHALALTTVTFSVETGEIYDADIELNSAETLFTTSDNPDEIVSDLASVLTHEIGHFLGLSHSAEETSVMRGVGYQSGSIELRTLTPDDVTGICALFPPGPTNGSCTPRHGFSPECGNGGTPPESDGCAFSPRGSSKSPLGLLALGALLSCFALRRARTARRAV